MVRPYGWTLPSTRDAYARRTCPLRFVQDGAPGAVRAGDRVEQDLGRLGGVGGGARWTRLALSGGFELLEKPLARGWELAVRHAAPAADVDPSRRRPGGLDQVRDGEEVVRGDKSRVRTETRAEVPNQGPPVRKEEAADEHRVGTSQGDASGEAVEAASLGVPPA